MGISWAENGIKYLQIYCTWTSITLTFLIVGRKTEVLARLLRKTEVLVSLITSAQSIPTKGKVARTNDPSGKPRFNTSAF